MAAWSAMGMQTRLGQNRFATFGDEACVQGPCLDVSA